jgi:2-C-methyl-D-erythritol 2,4-cyclodiphosphate synthase
MSGVRIGHGYDVHRLIEGQGIVLCGVNIPCQYSLLAHSDGDVALHALCDALLGALALGDIGKHFPDTDEKYKDADSLILLAKCYQLVCAQGYRLANADLTIAAQTPRLATHIETMRCAIASCLKLNVSKISVKATTTEKLGFVGRCEGIAVDAVVLLERLDAS